ncbi:MAG: ABC transporter permease [Chloroflexi bacterium]|nr:MAG: ABC transporter permease [Chloroflexota bacterium]
MNQELINALNSIVANATPLVIASMGETITERAGVVNLSLNGSIILSAMAGFVVALQADSLIIGLIVAILVGALIALIISVASIELRRDQIAVGFVLTLLAADLAQFLGQDFTRVPGPRISKWSFPILSEIPIIGDIFFDHDVFVYFSFVLVIAAWFWLFRTRGGLEHRAIGERPESAFARGTNVNRMRYFYTVFGGGLVGLAGAAYSLSVKPGWATPPAMQGDGWIALAIVIFGGWHPFRVVFGAYLFAGLRAASSAIQRNGGLDLPLVDVHVNISFILLNGLPWLLMILTLLAVSSGGIERLVSLLPRQIQNRMRNVLRSDPPAALGTRFEAE